MAAKRDLTGAKFGSLTVKSYAGVVSGRSHWHCVCECGNQHMARESHLLSQNIRSCGCLMRKGKRKYSGGSRSKTRAYGIWQCIKQRCLNPNHTVYSHYGGRGITISDKWLSFDGFYDDMGDPPFPKAEIDRVDNSKGYSKENCRWATRTENTRNTRSNRIITANGKTAVMTEWAESLGVNTSAIYRRIAKGMTEQEAVTLPFDRALTRNFYQKTNAAACAIAEAAEKEGR